MAEIMKRCKVYPRNGKQFIPGILHKRKKIEFPAELPLTLKEVRRCMSFADVYEMPEGKGTTKCVYLNAQNWMADNSKAEAAKDVPKDKLLYPRDEEEKKEDKVENPADSAGKKEDSSTSSTEDQKKENSEQNGAATQQAGQAQQKVASVNTNQNKNKK